MRKDKLIYEIISHPIRIKIIELLYEKGSLSFTDLKNELKISTGSLYYHLSILSDFIEQDPKRKYCLNSQGEKLYEFIKKEMKENSYQINKNFFAYISGLTIAYFLIENRLRLSFIPFLISLLAIFIFYEAKLEIFILLLFEKN